MKRARRVILIALVFLLIGAAVNVGVAWVSLFVWSSNRALVSMAPRWPSGVPADWPEPEREVWYRTRGWDEREMAAGQGGDPMFPGQVGPWRVVHRAMVIEAGWPLRSLRGMAWSGPHGQAAVRRGSIGAIRLDDNSILPFVPVMPGFAVDTVLYAAVAAAAWYGPGAARRAIRRSRSACISCGYSRAGLAHDAPCPECGGGGGVPEP
jgi:hypothetical protein